jgi:glycosyltransferase involved in cell wall biosynthesis
MHVGLVSFSDIDYGLDLATALEEVGIRVTLYMSRSHTARQVSCKEHPVERIYELGLLPPTVKLNLFQTLRMRDLHSFAVVRGLTQSMIKDRVDVAHILMGSGEIWIAVLACLLRKLPVVSTMREPIPNVNDYPPAFVVSIANRLLAYGSNMIIVNGMNHVDILQDKYGVPTSKVSYVPLGPRMTTAKWSRKAVLEENGTILFFGQIHRRKGLEYLVRAQPFITQSIPYAHIIIAGRGEKELEYCRKIMQDPSRFEILEGFVPNNIVAELFQRASLVVLPYISASTSGILMTAYVFGKPVVATRVGCLPEMWSVFLRP